MARKNTTRASKGVRNNEPVSDVDFEDQVEESDRLQDGLMMLPGSGAFRTRPAALSSDGDYYGSGD